jgi:squalene monooxygenase
MSSGGEYDIVIVGAGIAGSALAHALSTLPYPLQIALLERSLAPPDRIVGELLQPGGIAFLNELGLGWTLDGIGAVPVKGYCTIADGKPIQMPYPAGTEGRSFHHAGFVTRLREAAKKASGVDVIEATVISLLEDPEESDNIIGVRMSKKREAGGQGRVIEDLHAKLVVVADGCFSSLRASVMQSDVKPVVKSHFIGIELKDFQLPFHRHGAIVLSKDIRPVLLYDLSERDTRVLIDLPHPQPSDVKVRPASSPFIMVFFLTISW